MTIPSNVVHKYSKFASVFVETGTHIGKTVLAAHNAGFKRIYTIELADHFYADAVKKFAGYPGIKCIHGDSSKKLKEVLAELDERAVFWLDGHWSMGDTARGDKDVPLCEELESIANHHIKNHILLIDDIRLFGDKSEAVTGWHTLSVDKIKALCLKINPEYKFSYENGHVPNDILVAMA
jgi:hypothetical protein